VRGAGEPVSCVRGFVPAACCSQVTLKHEPFILHVQCRSVEAAAALLAVAVQSGYRESGMLVGQLRVVLG
jgi:tRNA wybutosine-synthesizing protein 3